MAAHKVSIPEARPSRPMLARRRRRPAPGRGVQRGTHPPPFCLSVLASASHRAAYACASALASLLPSRTARFLRLFSDTKSSTSGSLPASAQVDSSLRPSADVARGIQAEHGTNSTLSLSHLAGLPPRPSCQSGREHIAALLPLQMSLSGRGRAYHRARYLHGPLGWFLWPTHVPPPRQSLGQAAALPRLQRLWQDALPPGKTSPSSFSADAPSDCLRLRVAGL